MDWIWAEVLCSAFACSAQSRALLVGSPILLHAVVPHQRVCLQKLAHQLLLCWRQLVLRLGLLAILGLVTLHGGGMGRTGICRVRGGMGHHIGRCSTLARVGTRYSLAGQSFLSRRALANAGDTLSYFIYKSVMRSSHAERVPHTLLTRWHTL